MIKVNELRVGNLVIYTQDNDELPVLKIDGDSKRIFLDLLLGVNMEVREQDIDPIPLTPKWLEKCRFEQRGKSSDYKYGRYWVIDDFEIVESDQGGYLLFGSEWPLGKSFNHVHQLQNIYFALTGEELTIKLP